jgi:peptidyl-prolyl cis-trans isomerase B (cyclophilin B)
MASGMIYDDIAAHSHIVPRSETESYFYGETISDIVDVWMSSNRKRTNNQKKPINPKKRAIQTAQKRQSRGRIYLVTILILVIAIGVGWYVYASGQTGNQNMAPSGTGIVYAKLNTSKGLIEMELYNKSAPKTVTNFVNLANSHFYDNLVWHRIIPNFVIQTGDPNTKNGGGDRNTWGQGTSGQNVPFEYDSSLHNTAGYVAMASTGAGVGGSSQFYINVADNSAALDGKYAVFGKVIVGIDVVNALANVPTTNQYPNAQNQPTDPSTAMLISVTISNSL